MSLFMEDLELFLQNDAYSGMLIDGIVLIVLYLQMIWPSLGDQLKSNKNSLDILHTYCNTWGLEVNTEKTKIVVFRNRGQIRNNEIWTYNGNIIDVVEEFNYLGAIFNYNGSFVKKTRAYSWQVIKSIKCIIIQLQEN